MARERALINQLDTGTLPQTDGEQLRMWGVSTARIKKMEQRDFNEYVSAAIRRATMEHAVPTGPVPSMTPDKLTRLMALLSAGKENVWYNSGDWKAVKAAVRKIDHDDCLICKTMGRRHAARIVHHVKHLRDRPDLALSIYDPDTGVRQLISVCKDCHEMLHPEAQRQYRPKGRPVTAERWD